jgi:hypothetical protein
LLQWSTLKKYYNRIAKATKPCLTFFGATATA